MPSISEKIVEGLPIPQVGNKVHFFSGAKLQGKEAPGGFGVRCTAGGSKSFVWFHRVEGKKHLETLGAWQPKAGGLTVYDAISKCIDRRKAIAKGVDRNGRDVDPRPRRMQQDNPKTLDVTGLLDTFVERYVEKEAQLRSGEQIRATFDRLIKPAIGKVGIYNLRRPQIAAMLDKIADKNGPVMADRALAYTRAAFNWWHDKRDESFVSPIGKRMARIKPKSRRRKRVLADDEIRDLWAALEIIQTGAPVCYAAFVKTLLLTGTRRNEAADMSLPELEGDLWKIPAERYKTKLDHLIPLSAAARDLISTQAPTTPSKNALFVFSTTGGTKAFSGFSKAKAELDKAVAAIREREGREPMASWTLHDLRRTARTLMGRAGVATDHAELALGHVKEEIRDTYDCYDYIPEKRAAFEALAALVSRILNPTTNVEELASRRTAER